MAGKKRADGIEGEIVHIKNNIFRIPYRRKNGMPANRYYVKVSCFVCGVDYLRLKENAKRGGVPICNKACKKIYLSKTDGNEKFKRGNGVGHILVKCVNHPDAKKGWIPKHRLVMEQKIGRRLENFELVHHINMNKEDNDVSNLHIFTSDKSHFLAHGSLNSCVEVLIKNKIIHFDAKKGLYEIIQK